jgi:hypothetical protein
MSNVMLDLSWLTGQDWAGIWKAKLTVTPPEFVLQHHI